MSIVAQEISHVSREKFFTGARHSILVTSCTHVKCTQVNEVYVRTLLASSHIMVLLTLNYALQDAYSILHELASSR